MSLILVFVSVIVVSQLTKKKHKSINDKREQKTYAHTINGLILLVDVCWLGNERAIFGCEYRLFGG